MDIEAFKEVLDEAGIPHKTIGKALAVKECPECGDLRFKVHFNTVTINNQAREENDPLLGRCRHGECEQGFSSKSYLIAMGIDRGVVDALHDNRHLSDKEIDYWTDFFNNPTALAPPPAPKPELPEKVVEAAAEPVKPFDLSGLVPLEAWLDHSAAEYAVRRGAVPAVHRDIWIDPQMNAPLFLIRDVAGAVVGWQKRFVEPKNPQMKTQTSKGLEKTLYVLRFQNVGRPQLVCEGPFTALSAWHYGYEGVCTFGARAGEPQLAQIAAEAIRTGLPVGVAFDEDEAGNDGANRVERYMSRYGIRTFTVGAIGYNDLNDAWQAGCRELTATEPTIKPWVLDNLPEI